MPFNERNYTNGSMNIQQKLITMRHVIVAAPANALSSRRRNSPKVLLAWNSTKHVSNCFHKQETNVMEVSLDIW